MRKLWHWLFGVPTCRLRVFMRSGNSFILDGVIDFEVRSNGPEVVGLRLNQDISGNRSTLIMTATALSQIEAIVRLPKRGA